MMLEYYVNKQYYAFQDFYNYVIDKVNSGIKLSELKEQLSDNSGLLNSPFVCFVYRIHQLKSIQQVKKYMSALKSVYNILSR